MNKKKVAIFDIDGTIFRSSLLIELVNELIKAGFFPKEANDYEKEFHAWLDRSGTYDEYIDAVVESFLKHIKGVYYGDFCDVAEKVIDEQQHHTYRYTRDLVKDLKKKGYYILAISQSPKTILDKFCKNIGFDKVYGRLYQIGSQDRFTGEVIDLHLIANKANVVKRAVEKENLHLRVR